MSSTTKRRLLTSRQQEVFDYVRDKILNRGYGPTVREIGAQFGIRSPNGVMCHLKALEKKGLIIRESNMSRAIKLARNCSPKQSVAFLGTAASDSPFQAAVSSDERIDFADLLQGDEHVTLQVRGPAFADQGISDGDFLVIDRSNQGEPESMVVALDDRHHVVLCQIPHHGGTPVPVAPATDTSHNRQILGVLAGVVRKFDVSASPASELNGKSATDQAGFVAAP